METIKHISSGGIVFKIKDGQPLFLMLNKKGQGWVTPKGHIEGEETPEETAIREISEEAGIREDGLRIATDLGTLEYSFEKDGALNQKIVYIFLIEDISDEEPTPRAEEDFLGVEYFKFEDVIKNSAHKNMESYFNKAWEFLTKK